jgi:site-specific recombinase XerD
MAEHHITTVMETIDPRVTAGLNDSDVIELRFAAKVGYCANVASGIDLPRKDDSLADRIVPADSIRRMIQLEPEPRNRALLALIYGTGLRVSEACGLRWRDLQGRVDGGQLTVRGKGRRTRAVLLSRGIWSELVELRRGTQSIDPVFPSKTGKVLDRSRVLRIVKEAAARAFMPSGVTTHWLRHAHASHALDCGAPIHLVQATLGHASIATTSRYLHARPGQSSSSFVEPF